MTSVPQKITPPPAKSEHPLDLQLAASLRGDFEEGYKLVQHLERVSPDCHRSAFNRAWYRMMHGKLLEGLELLDRGRWANAFGDKPLPTTKPIYRNEDLRGKHLLLSLEGGLGDEIINARFVKDFADRGARVTIACDPGLMSVFARLEGVAAVVAHTAAPHVYHDFWVPGMSAARVLEYEYPKLTGASYLSVNPDHREKWTAEFSKRKISSPKIGLRFFGNPKFEHEQHRRFPKELLLDALEGRDWISLQKEETDLALESWEDTLAAIDQLDLVITSCTSVAHASAALGKETWILTPILPYYMWALPGPTSPWYKSVKLFRQTQFGVWDDVFVEVKKALNERFPK